MSWTPTDEQVEKHARVGYEFDEQHRVLFGYQTEPLPFESLPQWAQDTHREKARAQLVAVGPMIAAQALCDVHDEVVDELGLRFHHAWQVSAYITERADQIEKEAGR